MSSHCFSLAKKYFFIFVLSCITFNAITLGNDKHKHSRFISQQTPDIPPRPSPPKLVNDFAHALSAQEINNLERKLVGYANKTSTQIVIVSVPTIGDYEIAQYAVDLALDWGIGTKGKDNGLLILFALKEREVTIQTGYGLEEKVPDIEAARIIRSLINPNFKKGNYYAGLLRSTERIISLLEGEFVNQKPKKSSKKRSFSFTLFIFIIVFIVLISRWFSKRRGGNNNHGGGGGFFPIFFPFGFGGGSSYSSGGYSDSVFGDFGGFGGGDFGGGGASGDW